MDYQDIRLDVDGHLAIITIDREAALNALNTRVLTELLHAVQQLEHDDVVRVVALTGAGKAFVAGADIAEMQNATPRDASAMSARGMRLGAAMEASAKIYVAAVNGYAFGGGCELAMACDFIYASSRAKLGQPEVLLGVIPGFGGTQRLLRRVGVGKAKELVVTGAQVKAPEALAMGLVDAVFEPDELMGAVRAVAKKIAANGPLAVAEGKRLVQLGQSMSLDAAVALEQSSFANLFATSDQTEGMTAFLEKRKAEFTGS